MSGSQRGHLRSSRASIFLALLGLFRITTTLASEVDLPFGDINVLVVTDVHSHIGGHQHEKDKGADYGDILSFHERLKKHCDDNEKDLWFVNNGNWMHGTGLAMGGNATSLIPLLNKMPWDILGLGDDELYHKKSVDLMRSNLIPHFYEGFVSSNVNYRKKNNILPLGKKFVVLEGANYKVLVFGFLYDLEYPSNFVSFDKVEDVVKEEWFKKALKDQEYHAIMVMAHMKVDSSLVTTIKDAIRSNGVDKDMPIQFITGHTRQRAEQKIDPWSHSFQAGGNLDTLGFVSFPTNDTAKFSGKDAKSLFQHAFLDTGVDALKTTMGGIEILRTDKGEELSKLINETRHFLGLDEVVACPPQDYYVENHIEGFQSLWALWQRQVVPNQICNHQSKCVAMISSTTFRYGVRGSKERGDEMTLDDVVMIAPYLEPVYHLGKVNDYAIRRMNSSLNIHANQYHDALPSFVLGGDLKDKGDYEFYTHGRDLPEILSELERLFVKDIDPIPTGDKDTLYWLNYVHHLWRCDNLPLNNKLNPWFKNQNRLDIDKNDGKETPSESEDDVEWKEPVDGHYHGYLPGQGASRTPDYNHLSSQSVKMQQRAEALKKRQEKNAKLKKKILNIIGIIAAICILLYPVYYIGNTIFGTRQRFDSDELFYDPKELEAFKSRRQPSEIEIT
jgi:2',3'-cyclic-nucleotide 2'-phosphodiesterase (5'-nucleotidase family)